VVFIKEKALGNGRIGMADTNIEGRRIAVIGGSAGIGLATARLLAERGARVTIGGRDATRRDAAVQELGGGARSVRVDAEDIPSLRQFFSKAGPIDDLVVTVTRRSGDGTLAELAGGDLLDPFAGKTVPYLRAVALALPTLAGDGSITLVTGVSAQAGVPGTALLAAVNGAIEAAVRPLAVELAPRRVNAVSPGVIETGWWDQVPEEAKQDAFRAFAERTLLKRNGEAEDVAHAVVALIENRFVTGVALPCDGGLRLT
jgi:NAD(P)-dependent dehydrogenase (short-subunit alcohol dehydrogenase family)